jgi:hypothetical protein
MFDPTDHGAQALALRSHGPHKRFDHHRAPFLSPADDPDRGILYAARSLDGCLAEVFGDNGTGIVECGEWHVAAITLSREINLLEFRGQGPNNGAWRAGSVEALAKTADYGPSQEWSRYFYENEDIYSRIDGVAYSNAHNGDDAFALYERARDALSCHADDVIRLDDPALRPILLDALRRLGFTPPLPAV